MQTRVKRIQTRWLLFCWMVCLATVAEGASTDLTAYKPSWRVGQTWRVEAETWTQVGAIPPRERAKFVPRKITYGQAFTVEALVEIEGEMCYQVRVQVVTIDGKEIKPSPRRYRYFDRIFNRVGDCSLKMIQRFFEEPAEKALPPRKCRRGPVDATSWVGSLPLAFPVFSKDAEKYGPPDTTEPNAAAPIRRLQPEFWQRHQLSQDCWIVNDSEKSALVVSVYPRSPGDKLIVGRTEQIWIQGLPWPVYTKRTDGVNPDVTSRLVRVDGSHITATPRAQGEPK
jgi:hypothetical protein